jgi:apolipoprotein N-acyltransferase
MKGFAIVALASLCSGALFAAAMPPGDVQALGWICFVPLLIALRGARFAFAALAPLAAMMFGAWLTTTGWLYSWERLEGEDAWHYTFVVGSTIRTETVWSRFLLAAGFVAGESLLLVYLPGHIALSQYRSPLMLFLAPWIGIWGISWLVWFVQIELAWRLGNGKLTMDQMPRWAEYCFAGSLAVAATWEHGEPSGPGASENLSGEGVRVAIVQSVEPAIAEGTWASGLLAKGVQLVVWPELSASGLAAGGRTEKLRNLGFDHPPLVTTFTDGSQPKPYNAAAIFYKGEVSAHYRKRRPFAAEAKDHRAGTDPVAVDADGITVGLNICFDSCYPNLIRETARLEGVDLIALPCMGPESPYGVIQSIHGAFTPFRSAEMGVPIVRSESSAFAMVTNQYGRIVLQAPAGFQGLAVGSVILGTRQTLIKEIGPWTLWLAWGGAVWGAVGGIRARRKLRGSPAKPGGPRA